jgi:hypothetical protein
MHLIRIVVAGLIASGVAARAQTPNAKDFDLSCAVVGVIEMAQAQSDTKAEQNYLAMTSFYLGRLTVRDDRAHWNAILQGRVAERHDQPNPPDVLMKCVDFYGKKLN